ncbi:creatininase family protein [Pseudonocardia sp. HH130630-07]|uniref:creatininase family protein n=1 Tax=Pseudonocardia sp. HH130630-07 TaxID=1690815 RepID=UPI0008151FA5|nr:creatininase family protein [Pseudonocardia sp. HH130630-07]ANY07818.1 creatinine amidohydrolase [Pseudonocardia sp. HH130630-07]
MTTLKLAEMTTVEAAAAVVDSPVVVLPAGAFEQHGPGMPMATDLIRAEAVTEQVVARLDGGAVVGPSLPVGVSPHHLEFAGTVSLSTATFAAVLRDYVESLYRHGWRKILVVTGHGGNDATLGTVAQDLLVTHPDLQFAWSPLTPLAGGALSGVPRCEVTGHSGEAETAQMLAVAPDLVHTERLTPGTTELTQLDARGAVARRTGGPKLTLRYDQLTDNGVLGDPTRADAEYGAAIVEAIVQNITEFIQAWIKA